MIRRGSRANVGYWSRSCAKFTTVSSPFSKAAMYKSKSTVTKGVRDVITSRSVASVSPSRSNWLLFAATALATTTSSLS